MGQTILVGSGWNPFLFRAEINSLVGFDEVIHPRLISLSNNLNIDKLSKSALLDDILKNTEVIDYFKTNMNEIEISSLIQKWALKNLPKGSFAIRTRKLGIGIISLSSNIRGWY